ncbi:MAG: phage holin family protein [Chloroflexota bacterium]|jgi:hypothetical protein
MAEPERIYEREEPSRPEGEEPFAARRVREEGRAQAGGPIPVRRVREEASFQEVVQELISDIGDLVRSELQLIRQDIRSDMSALIGATTLLAAGGIAALLGVTFLLVSIAFALGTIMPLGWAFFVVGLVVLIAGGIAALTGWNRFKSINPAPEQTIETLREDAEWLQNRMR